MEYAAKEEQQHYGTKKYFYVIVSNILDDKMDIQKYEGYDEDLIMEQIDNESHNLDRNLILNETQYKNLLKVLRGLKE